MIWKILYGLIWIWQFPQSLLGFFVLDKVSHIGPAGFKYVWLSRESWFPGFCLGEYIFIRDPKVTRFMHGRGILSRQFGPLYFLAVTIPTLLVLIFDSDKFTQLYCTRWALKSTMKLR